MLENMLRSSGNPSQGRVEQTPDREGRHAAHSHRHGGPRDTPRSPGKTFVENDEFLEVLVDEGELLAEEHRLHTADICT